MKTTLETALAYFKEQYRLLIDNFGEEKHPEKIEAVKIAIDVIERFIPKEPRSVGLSDWYCPACGAWIKFDSLNIPIESAPKRCEECGQIFTWKG
jgi:predicted Zn finger-like uncharacterized protein